MRSSTTWAARSRKAMSCDEAEHLHRELGSRKAELTRVPGVHFRFTLASEKCASWCGAEQCSVIRTWTAATNSPWFTTLPILMTFGSCLCRSDPAVLRRDPGRVGMMLIALGIYPASALRRLVQAIGSAQT